MVLAQVVHVSWQESEEPYMQGLILMDAPMHDAVEHLIQIAEDRDEWRVLVNMIKNGEGDYDEEEVDV